MSTTAEVGMKVKTKYDGIFPKGTVCTIASIKFVEYSTMRVCKVESPIGEVAWYLDRDLRNI